MNILVAGNPSPTKGSDKLYTSLGINKLLSFLNERKAIEDWDSGRFLMVDSGAHSWNKMTINKVGMHSAKKLPDVFEHAKDYLTFIDKHKEKEVTYVELDCYGNFGVDYADGMWRDAMSMKGNFNFIRVYHPILDGGDLSTLKKWIDEGQTYIGLGLEAMPYFDKIFSMTKDKIKYHGFAMTRVDVIEKYPFFSVDSTTPISTILFGTFSNKYLKVYGKDDIIAKRSPRVLMHEYHKLEEALVDIKRTERYITELWTKRNVTWK